MTTHLILRYWYGYHRSKWQKWDWRWSSYERKSGTKIYHGAYLKRLQEKREHHRFWFNHYCQLLGAHGHHITCIHFGPGENTTQSGICPNEHR